MESYFDEFAMGWSNELLLSLGFGLALTRLTALMARYVREPLGAIKLSDLRPIDIQKVYQSMQERELSPRVIRYTHAVLSSALKQAVKWDMLHRHAVFSDKPRTG